MTLCVYIVENHIDAFKDHGYVETFQGLQIKYEQEKDRNKNINVERFFTSLLLYSVTLFIFRRI